MNSQETSIRTLWDQYLTTRSSECRSALVEHYLPVVQMQTALWACGLRARQAAAGGECSSDGLAEPAEGTLFLPFVPPGTWLQAAC